jgi:hypothetical protein
MATYFGKINNIIYLRQRKRIYHFSIAAHLVAC